MVEIVDRTMASLEDLRSTPLVNCSFATDLNLT